MGRLLGIDYGTKRIGLALTDELKIIASPFETHLNNIQFWDYLQKLLIAHKIEGFVVGKPLHNGDSIIAPHILGFVRKLDKLFALPIYLQDESLSSKESRIFLINTGKRGKKLKQNLDRYAAQHILSDFLQALEQNRVELFNNKGS